MGKNNYLTREQESILAAVAQDKKLLSQFYFTGGTALAYFYLHHRYSEDIDIFSETEFDTQYVLQFMTNYAQTHKALLNSHYVENVVYRFQVFYPNKTELKVDFAHYPYRRIEKGNTYMKLEVDSIFDIATNKLLTVSQRTDVKDFVDLYFLLKQDKISFWDLVRGIEVKFHQKFDPILLSGDLLKIDSFTVLPRMIIPVTLAELRVFYREKAKELSKSFVE